MHIVILERGLTNEKEKKSIQREDKINMREKNKENI